MLKAKSKSNFEVFNIGTGNGYSVMEIVKTFMEVNHIDLKYKIVEKREGDIEKVWADTSFANKELGWKAEFGLKEMLKSAWNWEKNLRNKENF